LGALATAGTLLRVARWTVARSAAARDLTALLRLGVPAAEGPDVIRVDGDTVLCHAAGAWAPRVLVSTPLLAGLTPELLAAALEHERAHLRRRDVLVRDLLAVLGSFAWPGAIAGAVAAWEQAAEEAADAAAADRFGGPLVASALVAVARLSLAPVPASMPAVGAGLHRRVRALLDCPRHRPAVALPVIPGLLLAIAAFAALNAESLHHAAETALHLLLRA
jgi:Zn-dependent protease with chaperone function